MKSQIIIYTQTQRAACIDDVSDSDCEIYDDNIGRYYEYLRDAAQKSNIALTFDVADGAGNGRSYLTEDDLGQEFMESVADFWSFYN